MCLCPAIGTRRDDESRGERSNVALRIRFPVRNVVSKVMDWLGKLLSPKLANESKNILTNQFTL